MVLLDVTHSNAQRSDTQHGAAPPGQVEESQAPEPDAAKDTEAPHVASPDDASPAAATAREPRTVGELIRATRVSRDWDIDELVRRTSLSPRIIRGVEADDFSASRGDCYARGHLRILARALSLDEATLLAAVPPSDPLAEDEPVALTPVRRGYPATTLLVLAVLLVAAVAGLVLVPMISG